MSPAERNLHVLAETFCLPRDQRGIFPGAQPTSGKRQAYDDAYWAVLEGKPCAFYPTNEWQGAMDSPVWDNEQFIPLFNAVKLAASLIGATDAERWKVVMNALRVEAEKYASYVAERA